MQFLSINALSLCMITKHCWIVDLLPKIGQISFMVGVELWPCTW